MDLSEDEQRVRVTNGRLWGPSQPFAAQSFSFGFVQSFRGGTDERQPEMRQGGNPGIGLELPAGELDGLASPRLCAFGPSSLGVDQGEQPETGQMSIDAFGGVRTLDGLQRGPARLVELAGEEQGLRERREGSHGQDVGSGACGVERTTGVFDRRADIASVDHLSTNKPHDRLEVGRPQLRPCVAGALRRREQPPDLDLRAHEQSRSHVCRCHVVAVRGLAGLGVLLVIKGIIGLVT